MQYILCVLELIFTKQHSDNPNDESDSSIEVIDEKSNSTKRPMYHRMLIEELNRDFNFTNWTRIIQLMTLETKHDIPAVIIDHKEYLYELNILFSRYSKQTVDNYLCWAQVAKFLPYLGPRFRRIYADFRREVPDLSQGVDSLTSSRVFLSRWKECVHITCEGLKLPSSILYLHHNKEYLQNAIANVKLMVDDIKNAFYSLVDKQSWLNNTGIKQRMKDRAREINSKVAFPDFVNSSESDEMYKLYTVYTDDVFVLNIIRMAEYEMRLELQKINQSLDHDKEWLFHPLISNAFADSTNKFIILPVGILRYPLLSFKRPVYSFSNFFQKDYLDYATLGVVIGHEIAHSFYNELKKEINSEPNWWTSELSDEYERRTQCFISQFSSYRIEEIRENASFVLSGNQTLEENICDYAGLQQAFTAYQTSKRDHNVLLPGLTKYTPDQLFFVQYAQIWCEIANEDGHRKSLHDSHAPGKFRANGVMVNTEQYASAFSCKLNSAMNPENKCKLWSAV
ncbi:Membrane metallo-endopeptidase-like 1 [Leptotrombidium deliense]|uniref:Membrane metallo-endopeptidase-like 1 n=1 Tax=Leptotrombidium deliense TaxID=299467 RepID=A0A443ST75_9ACAR|nr:Membrane metallo-endopeptidase-like 1 [Leptotrombidium deliense]